MRSLRYSVITGHPSLISSELKLAVASFTRADRAARYKIGITSCPERRHNERHYRRYHEMIVLYRTDEREHIEDVERSLIDHYWEERALANEIGGGGGRKGQPPYYLYVAVQKPNLIWRSMRSLWRKMISLLWR